MPGGGRGGGILFAGVASDEKADPAGASKVVMASFMGKGEEANGFEAPVVDSLPAAAGLLEPSSSKSGWSIRAVSDFFFDVLGLGSRCFMPHLVSVEGGVGEALGEPMLSGPRIIFVRPP